ncbi:hypothetical protein GQ43DRAFT_441427 [Delitschia confertaspora ATCC 74209]|uniref:Acyltransferase 3 domain-containing protein n=1 Tax=Delitschia confertaspora ATCC 74209 TaxID=1513339 RepID=A0A9P4MUX9_9PLEO|nr:hypothetical protein GQ43DRAFT_441427 [Delitschia confertaspora ATCC 74209]
MVSYHEAKRTDDRDNHLPSLNSPTQVRQSFSKRVWTLMTPTFLKPRAKEADIPTAFLDGVRGYAAFFVFITHNFLPSHPNAYYGYGGGNGTNDHYLLQLPIIRLIHSGLACVHIFFVISGFSISLKPIKLMRQGKFDAVFTTLVSSTFRRTCRLYFPCFALLLCVLLLTFLGAFDTVNELVKDWPFGDQPEAVPPLKSSFFAQIGDLLGCIWEWADPLNPYSRITYMPYSLQLWTIPVELRCSFITFIALLGLAKTRPYVRMTCLALLSFYFYARKHSDPPLFLGGAIFAELYLIRHEKQQNQALNPGKPTIANPDSSPSSSGGGPSTAHKLKYGTLFLLALFLLSYPRKGGDLALFYRPFHHLAVHLVGSNRKVLLDFFTCSGSLLLVYTISASPWLQQPFSTPLARYLGRTSFALYCVHQPLVNWFGYSNVLAMWRVTGREGWWGYEGGFAVAFVWQVVVSVWLADIFFQTVDMPSVRFARWVEGVCGV